MDKELRETKVTVRFTASEMSRIMDMMQQRNEGKSVSGERASDGIKELSLSEFIREKILILNKNLELKKIRLELAEINTKLGQIGMYLSRKGAVGSESFTEEVFCDIQKRIKEIMLRMEGGYGGYGSEEH